MTILHRRKNEAPQGRCALAATSAVVAALLQSSSAWGAPPNAEPKTTVAGQKETVVVPAEHEKRSDFLFLEGETGAQYVGLETLSVKRDVIPTLARREDIGAFVGAMAGAKLIFLSVGPHLRWGHFTDWDLWTLDLDVGFHAPLGSVEPFIRLGGGYARLVRAFDRLNDSRGLTTHGYHLALTVGADVFFANSFTLGGRVSGDLFALHRAGVDLNASDGLVNDYLKYDAASAGLGMTGALALGLHF
jgi:hypothetical protein